MKSNQSAMTFAAFFLGLLMIFSSSLFIVREGEVSMVLRIGKFITQENDDPVIYEPGLHFKAPLIDKVVKLSTKIQSINEQATRILTKEQKPVEVDYFVKWKITDFQKFYKATIASSSSRVDFSRVLENQQAEYFLKNNVADALRSIFGAKNLHDIIAGGRDNILQELRDKSSEGSQTFGIQVIDVRIKKLDYPREISASVYQRMRTKRQQVANLYRANGEFAAEKIRSNADKEYRLIIAGAEKDAAKTIAFGEKQASEIYNQAYTQSKELYKLYRKLEGYKKSLGKNDLLLIDPKSYSFFNEFLKPEKI
ncbi:protease modulator HflC [Gammaproteobacteria bacterium]|nr:protease modulator HflC [Gammaproteobacteria bacterium]